MSATPRRFGMFSNVRAVPRPKGKYVLAGRMLSGMEGHRKYWDGQLVAICEPAADSSADRALGGDDVEVDPRELPFELFVANFDGEQARRVLAMLTVAAVGVDYRSTHLSRWGRELDVPVVYGSEYSLKTRLDVWRAQITNPIMLARKAVWELDLERRQRAAISIAAGIQCNGVPTYEAYRKINPNAMLFFDGRLEERMFAGPELQAARHERMRKGEPLRLAWSGRMNHMKGPMYLPRFARHLADLGVPFQLEIFGGGVLEEPVRAEVAKLGLSDRVHVKGFVDFYDVLTPYLQREIDIWVCPHPQGDPSGAYMEALGHGLPIIGFGNEALAGMFKFVDAGEVVPVGDTAAFAKAVARAHANREQLIRWSTAARAFATEHTFDKSFERRMKHIDALLAIRALRGEQPSQPA